MSTRPAWEQCADGLRIRLRVQPRSSRNRVAGLHGQAVKVCVTAPPVDGSANAAVIALLADLLEVPRSRVSLVAGAAAREKQVIVAGPDSERLVARLEAAVACVDNPQVGD
jgi:uncharacterized protein (TIGR00251 family)